MCVKPKQITTPTGHLIYVPCGKCLDCQNQSRSEWVLRCKYELQVNKHAYFVTLTYDNKFLPAAYMDYEEKQSVLLDIKLGLKKDYSDFLLDKNDLSFFLKRLQDDYQRTFHTVLYNDVVGIRKQLAIARKEDNIELICRCKSWLKKNPLPKLRYMATGEYGKLSKIPHYHILLFTKDKLSELDVKKMCERQWRLGIVDVEIPKSNEAVFNYVSKHQIKEDFGSEFQNQVSPIFKKCSTYNGGIGYNLRNDVTIRNIYAKRDEGEPQVVKLPYNKDVNVFPFPRYVKKFLHPNNLSFIELSKLESDSTDRVLSMLTANGYHFTVNDVGSDSYLAAIKAVFHKNSVKDFNEKQNYFKNKYINKLLKNRKYGR